jgi:hypothetical protein
MPHVSSKLATLALVAGSLLVAACSERGPTEPGSLKAPTRTSADVVTTTTVWDFVALAGVGSDVEIGASHSYVDPTAGTIVASVAQTLASPGVVQLYAKGTGEVLGDEEKGLGFCFQPAGLADECTTTGEDEIGDGDGQGHFPSVQLDFTGLTAGTVVTSVMLSSLQSFEAYAVSSSTNGTTWTPFASGVGSDAAPVITLPVTDPTIKYLRFEVGNGGAGNNYLLASATTSTTPPQLCEDQTATNYGGPLPCVYPPKNGCTPGYWKQDQHFDSWVATGLKPTDLVSSLFSKASLYSIGNKKLSAYKLVEALGFQGGSDLSGAAQILIRAGVAAELNARYPGMNYPMTASDIVTAVNNALNSGNRTTIINLATQLDNNNNLGCTLN